MVSTRFITVVFSILYTGRAMECTVTVELYIIGTPTPLYTRGCVGKIEMYDKRNAVPVRTPSHPRLASAGAGASSGAESLRFRV